jgi:hypothetical protein
MPVIDVTDMIKSGMGGGSITPDMTQSAGISTPQQSLGMQPTSMRVGGMTFSTDKALAQQNKDIGVQDTKRKIYKKDLETFLAIDDVLQEARGEGLGRFKAGAKMSFEGFKQDSPLGMAVASHDAAKKRLRVQLVRAAGDVGNINIVEQKAAEMLISDKWDAKGTAKIKRAYLEQIGKAIDNNDANLVKETISSFMKTPEFNKSLPSFKNETEAEKANLPKGSIILINGKKATVN